MKTKSTTQVLTIDPTQFRVHEVRVGLDPRGPHKCLQCGQPFKTGEVWQRMKSPPDPELGSYVVGIHSQCLKAH